MSAAPRQLKLPIPTHLINGSLSSGKTSLILSFLRAKQAAGNTEVWAVLVNEFGALGIDAAALDGAGAVVRELAGGCLCCAMPTVTSAALVQLVRATKPDRLLVEPSGLAHPAALLRLLRGPHLATALDLRPITCLVDLTTFDPEKSRSSAENTDDSDTFGAQIEVADVLVGTKADLCCEERLEAFYRWAVALKPPKRRVLVRKTSEMSAKDVEIVEDGGQERAVVEASSLGSGRSGATKKVWLSNATAESASPGRPLRMEGSGSSNASEPTTCGWVFDRNDVFSESDLCEFVREAIPVVLRLKGIFRVGLEPPRWVLASVSSGTAAATPGGEGAPDDLLQELPGEQSDSRVEVIVGPNRNGQQPGGDGSGVARFLQDRDWEGVERALLKLLRSPTT